MITDDGFPSFTAIECSAAEVSSPLSDFCVKVDYPNDHETDYLLLKKDEEFIHNMLFERNLKNEEDVPAAVMLADNNEDPPDTYTTVRI